VEGGDERAVVGAERRLIAGHARVPLVEPDVHLEVVDGKFAGRPKTWGSRNVAPGFHFEVGYASAPGMWSAFAMLPLAAGHAEVDEDDPVGGNGLLGPPVVGDLEALSQRGILGRELVAEVADQAAAERHVHRVHGRWRGGDLKLLDPLLGGGSGG